MPPMKDGAGVVTAEKPRVRVKAGSAPALAPAMSGFGLSEPPPPNPHQGASIGRRMGGWRPTAAGPNSVVQTSGPELVRRSRDLVRNNPHARRAVGLMSTHVVGIGIKPRFQVKHEAARRTLTELWEQWVAVADADQAQDFYGLQALAMREVAEGGECFCRLRPRRLTDGLPVPLQLQLLPAEQVPLNLNRPNGTNDVTHGIERDLVGRRVAYWCLPEHPNDANGWRRTMNMPSPVPAEDVCHVYNKIRVGQLRGLPWLAAAMTTLKQVADYVDAELLRKQLAASIVAFVRKVMSEDMTPEQIAAAFGALRDAAGDLPEVAMEPGTVQYLGPGESIDFNTPSDVGANYEGFVNGQLRQAAMAVDVLYEELTGNWRDTNDRTFRAQFNTFKRQVQQWQYGLMVAQLCAPVAARFISYAVASGALKVPKSVTDRDLHRIAWLPHRHEYIQPVQDVQATLREIEGGLQSRGGAVAERGDNVEDIDEQVAADRARERTLGLTYAASASKGSAASVADDPEDEGSKRPSRR